MNNSGFTLLELLVTITVMGILGAIAITACSSEGEQLKLQRKRLGICKSLATEYLVSSYVTRVQIPPGGLPQKLLLSG